VLVVNFDETNFSGAVEAELRRLEAAGTLRVVDILVVAKTREGEIEVVRSQTEIAQALIGDGPGEDRELTEDEWVVADAVQPGGAAAIVILEHKWAIPLREAIEGAGGHDVVTEWTTPEALREAGIDLTA